MSLRLDTLPPELLLRLPYFVHSIEDILSLSSTCRVLYHTCANPSPHVISKLVAESGRIFFRPHPHMLIAATARQLADWAIQHDERRFRLEEAIRGGVDKLLELAIDVVGLTMDDIRRLLRFKYAVLNPLDKQLDLSSGPGSGYGMTICNDPETTLLTWVIYGELFHHSMELGYLSSDQLRHQPLSSVTRYKWLAYCVPDVNSFNYLNFKNQPNFFKDYKQEENDRFQQLSLQTAMDFLCPQLWEDALQPTVLWKTIDPVIRETYVSCAMNLGFSSLELLVPGGPERLTAQLELIAASLSNALNVGPGLQTAGRLIQARNAELRELIEDPWWLTGFPDLDVDLSLTLWGNWSGENGRVLMKAIRTPAVTVNTA
ncbi:hypothetical protein MIND_00691300 [Mycena indigotica]|uniref:F-box domain-containing protein n=1 Tax=Mycena indigotica TaxID=2126181 RepID=A0A8H6SK95_9AGAR|nr:uncharacterized protein MIND_00691300 [Mycena indigotica]KAF7301265.1 hypothetical protein MIND_00691300 [Mycena indigotica]